MRAARVTTASWWRWALAALSGVLLTLLSPPFSLAALAWVALAPLVVALNGVTPGAGFMLGWLTGTVGSLGVTGFWIFRAARDYFQLSPLGAAAFTVGVNQILVALYFGVFGMTAAMLTGWRLRPFLIPVLFVATEYARAHVLIGNPWALLGQSQAAAVLIQVCDLTGVYGLSFVLALVAAAVTELHRTRIPAAVAALAVAVVLAYGEWRLPSAATSARAAANVPLVLVQGNIPNAQRGHPQFFSEHLTRYLSLTRHAGASAPSLIIWPESAIGFFPEANPSLVARLTETLQTPDVALLTGAPRAGTRTGVAALHNSAYLFTADGIRSFYDKRVLLPFVERMPLRREDGPYLPGGEPTIFSFAGSRFGVLICYEAIYPELARELVARGAQFLVNISNDSWFEAGAGPEQHYAAARLRAIENHVSLVRVTNSGVSGVIDPNGREISRLPVQVAVAQSVSVPIGPGESFYSRHGDIFAVACVVVGVVALAARRFGRAQPPRPNFSIR